MGKRTGRGSEPFSCSKSGICAEAPHFFPKLLSKEGGTGVVHGFFSGIESGSDLKNDGDLIQ